MPIYEYACSGCQHEFEVLVRNDESPVCPSCESEQLSKLFSVPAAPSVSAGQVACAPLPSGGCGLPRCGGGGCSQD